MANSRNELLKRRYFKLLREAKEYSESTVVAISRAIHLFEQFTGFKDFASFGPKQATAFKGWLATRRNKGKSLSVTSRYHHLRHLQAFMTWLSQQPGFRTKISLDAVSYLSMGRKNLNEVHATKPRSFPSLEQVKTLVESIPNTTDMDRRDRALIALMLLTGMRYSAICSLPLGCIDIERRTVHQDPTRGVKTKAGKAIRTHILGFDKGLVIAVEQWVSYLQEVKKFAPSDPLFPRTKIEQAPDGSSFEARGLEPIFWTGGDSIRNILKHRSSQAGLPYFNPHAFRHAHVHIALMYCRTPEELKALSQSIGHEQVTTTLRSYGTLDNDRVGHVLSSMQFDSSGDEDQQVVSTARLRKALADAGMKLD